MQKNTKKQFTGADKNANINVYFCFHPTIGLAKSRIIFGITWMVYKLKNRGRMTFPGFRKR